jgi:putative ABC transport system substrate-binding protein
MAYYRDFFDAFRQVADQVAQILDGGNLAEMPFRQPTSLSSQSAPNRRETLGLLVPLTLLASADEVIE